MKCQTRRREIIRGGLATVAAGLAGCTSGSEGTPPSRSATSGTTVTTTERRTETTLDAKPLDVGGEWPTFHHDDRNSSDAGSASGVPDEGTVYWRLKHASLPVVSNGTLFVTGKGGENGVVARDANTGRKQWSTAVEGGAFGPSMALSQKNVFLTTYENVYAINRRSGEIFGESTLGRGPPTAPKVLDEELYFSKGEFGDSPAHLYAADARTGRMNWNFEPNGNVTSAVSVDRERVYVGTESGTVYAIDRTDGSKRWTFSASTSITGSPVVSNNRVFAVTDTGRLFAIQAGDGNVDWQTSVNSTISNGGIAVTERTAYLGAGDGLHAFDVQSGHEQWHFETQASATTPTVANGVAYFGTSFDGRYLRAVDTESGMERWKYRTPKVQEGDAIMGGVHDAPVVVDNAIYALAAGGRLYAFGKK